MESSVDLSKRILCGLYEFKNARNIKLIKDGVHEIGEQRKHKITSLNHNDVYSGNIVKNRSWVIHGIYAENCRFMQNRFEKQKQNDVDVIEDEFLIGSLIKYCVRYFKNDMIQVVVAAKISDDDDDEEEYVLECEWNQSGKKEYISEAILRVCSIFQYRLMTNIHDIRKKYDIVKVNGVDCMGVNLEDIILNTFGGNYPRNLTEIYVHDGLLSSEDDKNPYYTNEFIIIEYRGDGVIIVYNSSSNGKILGYYEPANLKGRNIELSKVILHSGCCFSNEKRYEFDVGNIELLPNSFEFCTEIEDDDNEKREEDVKTGKYLPSYQGFSEKKTNELANVIHGFHKQIIPCVEEYKIVSTGDKYGIHYLPSGAIHVYNITSCRNTELILVYMWCT